MGSILRASMTVFPVATDADEFVEKVTSFDDPFGSMRIVDCVTITAHGHRSCMQYATDPIPYFDDGSIRHARAVMVDAHAKSAILIAFINPQLHHVDDIITDLHGHHVESWRVAPSVLKALRETYESSAEDPSI